MRIMQFLNGQFWPVDSECNVVARVALKSNEVVEFDQVEIEDALCLRAVGSLNLFDLDYRIVAGGDDEVQFELRADATDVIAEMCANMPEGKSAYFARAKVGALIGGAEVAQAVVIAYDHEDAAMEAETCFARHFPGLTLRVTVDVDACADVEVTA